MEGLVSRRFTPSLHTTGFRICLAGIVEFDTVADPKKKSHISGSEILTIGTRLLATILV